MATWSTKQINDFPDSSFAWIQPGGSKDNDGKTTPRTLRHLPYKDEQGNVDLAHVRNALARLGQVQGMPADVKAKVQTMLQNCLKKEQASVFRVTKIELDAQGQLPTKLMLMQTGEWPNSIKGDFSISLDDLKQIKQNFDNGVGFPTEDASTGLAIDFKHEYDDQAAGWIKGLELVEDGQGGGQLFANPVEWSDVGAQAVQNGRFKCISPSGYFGKKGTRFSAWPNPTNLKETVRNVLDGAGLTNIPFLRGMSPVRASAEPDQNDDNALDYGKVVFISSVNKSQNNKGEHMNVDELRVKDRDELSVPELDFLAEHKDELSAEEVTKFKLDADGGDGAGDGGEGEGEDDNKSTLSAEDSKMLADIKAGNLKVVKGSEVVVEKSELDALKGSSLQYQTEKAEGIVDKHIGRGAIKADAKPFWTGQLLAATGEDRTNLEAQLEALPANEALGEEQGHGEDIAAGATAREQLHNIANEKIAAAAKAGKEMLYPEALKLAIRENPDIALQDLKEVKKEKVGA